MARVFTREQFYELVWSKPMTHLAKEFAGAQALIEHFFDRLFQLQGIGSAATGEMRPLDRSETSR